MGGGAAQAPTAPGRALAAPRGGCARCAFAELADRVARELG
ncbi:hypothetical protein BC739_006078 [Kutzneria viridogrisea]|uniref:Uncharacterized protein n=1 Tax=Kutzneria viridogrisea TaxID=47990 RepID=A0ABR6BPM3_9PSEU|nr:hypothetical protein [Kutzneria albida]MBA8928861.1 hypothetical protein [Kutzneria viridogrisea]